MISEIVKNTRKIKRKESYFLRIQGILASILICLSMISFYTQKASVNKLKSIEYDRNVYSLVDQFDSEFVDGRRVSEDDKKAARQFFQKGDFADKLKELYVWESREFKYLIEILQPVVIKNKELPAKFEYGYEDGVKTGSNISLQVNDYFFKHFCLEVEEGKLFEEKDYLLTSDSVPVILGNEYRQYIGLNEKLKIQYLNLDLDCKVVGFLPKGSYYSNYNAMSNITNLGRYVILPSFDYISHEVKFESNNGDRLEFEKMFYQQKSRGHIVYLDEYSEETDRFLCDLVGEKCKELDIKPPYTVLGRLKRNSAPPVWGMEGDQLVYQFWIFSVIIFVISLVCMSINMAAKILSLKKFYAIWISNGVPKRAIYFAITREILGINSVSALLFIILLTACNSIPPIFAYMGIGLYLIISIAAAIYPCLVFKRLNIAKTLQGDN